MWNLLQIELYKIFRKPRTYISFGAIAAFILLIQLALLANGKQYLQFGLGFLDDSFDIPYDKINNGYWICFLVLNLLLIHVPILVALVAGDIVSGEANMGTLRLLVSKPISRTELILAKFFAAAFYVIVLLAWMALFALGLSVILFGTGDVVVAKAMELHQVESADVLWRYFAAFGFAALALILVASLSLLLSSLSDNSIGPIVATVCIIIVCTLISEMQIPLYDKYLRPYLFTTYMLGWKGFFYIGVDADGQTIRGSIQNFPAILKSIGVLITYTIGFVTASVLLFRKKDILS
ncbi:MAG: ABC transporter permease subunit [Chitinophagaceae bacterium]|nr:ABC transporter permease subunit [Chitinophagaceae bacterium]